MDGQVFLERFAVGALAALVALVYAVRGTREQRFVVAPFAVAIGLLVALRTLAPVVAYGLLCLAMVSVYLLREERVQRRRVASLAPRAAVDAAPAVWIVTAAASALMLLPYIVLAQQRAAAVMVGVCTLAMAAIAWRISSAPVQLTGTDIELERARDRAYRSRRAGLTAVLAVGIVFVFINFVNAELRVVMPVQHMFVVVSLLLWAGLWSWVAWYVHRLDRVTCAASP